MGNKIYYNIAVTLTIFISIMNIYGCVTIQRLNKLGPDKPTYVANVSESTSFVVFPFNDYLKQIEFATNVESVLLQAGLNVLAPPRGNKSIEERKGAGVAQAGGVSDTGATASQTTDRQSIRIEKYTVSDDINADYIINTMLSDNDGTVKFTKKEDMRVVGVVVVDPRVIEWDLLPYLERLKFIKSVSNDNNSK